VKYYPIVAPNGTISVRYGGSQTKLPMNKREFMVWDGEGVTDGAGARQRYVLLGWSNSDTSNYISGPNLSTEDCLTFLYNSARDWSEHIHVSFGFGYDVDQILKDVSDDQLMILKQTNTLVLWDEWKITYIPHKLFKLKRIGKGNPEITIADAMTFFGTSLVKAAQQYVPDHPNIDKVRKGKTQRNSFTYGELYTVILPYWQIENELFLATMFALRSSLRGAGIEVQSWHGPGAVANALIKKYRLGTHIQQSRDMMPLEVTEACQFSYFGGRFENFIMGHIPGPIYAYDIRSAYPAAMSRMPGLKDGQWNRVYPRVIPDDISPWGLYRYTLHATDVTRLDGIGALPFRGHDGTVSFGLSGSGWSFGHELIAAHYGGQTLTVHTGWEYEGSSNEYPFIYNHEMYVKRAQFKANGNPAQLGLKLGMNSGYGKLAQTVGYDEDTMRPPKYHHPWYAGQITAWCRARIYLAMMSAPESIIACETDGIYSLAPLDVRVGPHLGDWEATVYNEMYYVQSGFYFARKGKCPPYCPHNPHDEGSECAWKVAKVRGLSTGKNADLSMVFNACNSLAPIRTSVTRYGSLTGHIGRSTHHVWFDQPREAVWGGGGKRYHEPNACDKCLGRSFEYHRTVMTQPFAGSSHPRGLPWVDDPEIFHPE